MRLFWFHLLLLALHGCATGTQAPCFDRCRFALCDDTKELRVSATGTSARTAPICSQSGESLGIVGSTGQARVRSGGSGVPLDQYKPDGLLQCFSPHFLKAVKTSSTSSGITHESLQRNQYDFIDGLCVAVPLMSAQVLGPAGNVVANRQYSDPDVDCVALKLRRPSTVEQSTQTRKPTTQTYAPSPSASEVITEIALPSPDLETTALPASQFTALPVKSTVEPSTSPINPSYFGSPSPSEETTGIVLPSADTEANTATTTPTQSAALPVTGKPEDAPMPVASLYTDPHLQTFDGLRYSCQGVGEFVLVKSGNGFEVQGRFYGNATRLSASVTVGIVVKAPRSPKVQVSIPGGEGCAAPSVHIDGVSKAPNTFRGVKVTPTSIEFDSGSLLTWRMSNSAAFGCYFERLLVRLAPSDRGTGLVYGLLGTPDGDQSNDWSTKDGKKIALPAGDGVYGEEAYNYCTKNWCLRKAADSLFVYENGATFASLNSCDAPYRAVPLSNASPELRTMCRGDLSCIFDGLATGSLEEARRALRAQEELEAEAAALSNNTLIAGRQLLGKRYDTDYETERSTMTFRTQEPISEGRFDYLVTSVYSDGSGAVSARLDVEKRQLVGNWSNPAGSCRRVSDTFSGSMVFNFSADWSSFVGVWDRCFDGRLITWTGTQGIGDGTTKPTATPAASPSSSPKPIGPVTNGRELLDRNYSTTYRKMVFGLQEKISVGRFDYNVTGAYGWSSGKIFAFLDIEKRELVGNWSEAASGCGTVGPGGNNYWGAILFKFAPDWGSFDGKWGTCGAAPSSSWRGSQIRG